MSGNELHIDRELFPFIDQLAPGVVGYSVDTDGELWIPVIHAVVEGAGDVGRFLDGLPRDRRVVVPTVINPRLAGMLSRRGFTEAADRDLWHRPAENHDTAPRAAVQSTPMMDPECVEWWPNGVTRIVVARSAAAVGQCTEYRMLHSTPMGLATVLGALEQLGSGLTAPWVTVDVVDAGDVDAIWVAGYRPLTEDERRTYEEQRDAARNAEIEELRRLQEKYGADAGRA